MRNISAFLLLQEDITACALPRSRERVRAKLDSHLYSK